MPFFKPILAGVTLPDRLIACLGAAVAVALTMVLCSYASPAAEMPVLVAPLGASAILVFAVPASPLAQPWSILGGNVVSALVGVSVFRFVPNPATAAGIAVGAATLAMSLLRCLHPPGGAVALTAVIGGSAVHNAGYDFVLVPVGINSLVLVAIALVHHRATMHSYPHRPVVLPMASGEARWRRSDIDAALGDMHEGFDIDGDDLETLLAHAERHAATRITNAMPQPPRAGSARRKLPFR